MLKENDNTKTNRQTTWEGEIATYCFDDNGILVSFSKNAERTVQNISDNVSLVKRITGNRKVSLFKQGSKLYLFY